MGGCVRLIRELVLTWLFTRIGMGRVIGCGCLLIVVAAICVFYLVNSVLQVAF